MKLLISILILSLTFCSCDSKGKNTSNLTKHTSTMNKIEYNITFSFKNVGYQIFVNDILVDQRLNGGMNNSFNINEFLLNQEKQRVKIRLLSINGKNLTKNDIETQQCVVFKSDKATGDISNLHKFIFKGDNIDTPVFELNQAIETKDKTPLVGAEILIKATNLSNLDKDILEEKLKKKYELMRNELNNGNYNFFIKELDIRNKIYFESYYYTNEEEQKYISNAIKMLNEFKSKMLPIENYKMVISANGKLCTLERIDKKYVGNGVLLAENHQDNIIYLNYLTFFIPQNQQELKIFSLNSRATSLEN